MAPIHRPNNRVQAIGSNKDALGMDTPRVPVGSAKNFGELKLLELSAHDPTPRKGMKDLSFQLVASKFGMPIAKAAKELEVGKTTLALWCRISGISRWPYRKIRSMDILITSIKDFGKDERFGYKGVEGTIKMLEEEKNNIEKNPSLALQDNTLILMKRMHHQAYNRKRGVKKGD